MVIKYTLNLTLKIFKYLDNCENMILKLTNLASIDLNNYPFRK